RATHGRRPSGRCGVYLLPLDARTERERAARRGFEIAAVALVDDDRAHVLSIEQVVDACERTHPRCADRVRNARLECGNDMSRCAITAEIVDRYRGDPVGFELDMPGLA